MISTEQTAVKVVTITAKTRMPKRLPRRRAASFLLGTSVTPACLGAGAERGATAVFEPKSTASLY
jgi:hypothetical protein